MAWTETARRQNDRHNSRYASDLTDAEWLMIEPLMPASNLLDALERRACEKW